MIVQRWRMRAVDYTDDGDCGKPEPNDMTKHRTGRQGYRRHGDGCLHPRTQGQQRDWLQEKAPAVVAMKMQEEERAET